MSYIKQYNSYFFDIKIIFNINTFLKHSERKNNISSLSITPPRSKSIRMFGQVDVLFSFIFNMENSW